VFLFDWNRLVFGRETGMDDMKETRERIESIVASTEGIAVTSDALLKTLGNHLFDLLREGECLEIERNFECVSGLSVTAVAANGRESTIGIGPEASVRRSDRDWFAEKCAQVLSEAGGCSAFDAGGKPFGGFDDDLELVHSSAISTRAGGYRMIYGRGPGGCS